MDTLYSDAVFGAWNACTAGGWLFMGYTWYGDPCNGKSVKHVCMLMVIFFVLFCFVCVCGGGCGCGGGGESTFTSHQH